MPVTCVSLTGTLYKYRFRSGSRGKCIRTEERWFTPEEFVKQEPTLTNGNWRKDILCHGKTLNFLLKHCQYLLLCVYREDTQKVFVKDPRKTVPRYSEFITQPMWLDRIKQKLESGAYRTVGAFVSDFQLIFSNCRIFNRDNEFGQMGARLKKMFEEEFQKIFSINGLGNMEPAGPLYDIDCSDGSISGLHLPHCEIFSEEDMDCLTVAHLTGGNVAIMNPLKVTEAHVMIDIEDLSLFGLIKRMIFPPSPVTAQTEVFKFNFGPNYHPTFEVFVNVRKKEVKLSLIDNTERREVWPPRRILLTESEFVNNILRYMPRLIRRVSSAMEIADGLMAKNMITNEIYSKVRAVVTPQERMRLLWDALNSGGDSVKAEFYRLLKENEPHLVNELYFVDQ
ncbi:nuclear body protein SP140 isoform X1 [Labeo rohita]|uniref:Nuclear body protein SP140 isoform X1 n=1 Tax=Labeo rohita TaxID=84645 RepID=A0A498MU21_LABRO|nr:nuclear body protein SP140 isoform X1 [Labeo rohita]